MKRFGRLFEKIANLENLERAYRNARRGKSWQKVVQEFDANHQQGLQEIQKIGVDFVGYRHFPKKKLLRKSTSRQMKKTLYALQKHWPQCSSIRFRSTLASYDGWAKWAQTYHLRQKLEINKLQEMIGMRGIPKHLNTKFDYEFIRSQNLTGWQKHWQDLLDGYMGWISTGVLADGETGVEDETHKVDTQEEKELDSNVVTTTRYQLEYKVDPNSKLLRIGFTLEEVETGLS